MTKLSTSDCSDIDIDDVLEQRRQVAVVWSLEDVQEIRSDLNDDQAWEVLKECLNKHDCELGFTWGLIEVIADNLFPRGKDGQRSKKGGRQ